MEMLWNVEFYKDVLYHDSYGMMINSGEFTGTPGDRAKREVIRWLEEQGFGTGAPGDKDSPTNEEQEGASGTVRTSSR